MCFLLFCHFLGLSCVWRGDPEERTYSSRPGSLLRDNSSKMLIISVASVTFIPKSCTRSFTEAASSFGTAWTDSMRSPVVEYVSGWGFFFLDRKKHGKILFSRRMSPLMTDQLRGPASLHWVTGETKSTTKRISRLLIVPHKLNHFQLRLFLQFCCGNH